MTTAQDVIDNLNNLHVEDDAAFVVSQNLDAITALNKVQMLQGVLPSGQRIGVYRNRGYAIMKQQMNPLAGGGVDLKLTGAFQGKMTTKGNGTEWETDSGDSKRDMLVEKYDDPFGLSESSQKIFNESIFLPDFLKLIEMKTGLKAG